MLIILSLFVLLSSYPYHPFASTIGLWFCPTLGLFIKVLILSILVSWIWGPSPPDKMGPELYFYGLFDGTSEVSKYYEVSNDELYSQDLT